MSFFPETRMIAGRVYALLTDDIYSQLDGVLGAPEALPEVEGLDPAGSIRLNTALALINDAERRGGLRAGGWVLESSSGNLPIGLRGARAEYGQQFDYMLARHKAILNGAATIRALSAHVVVVTKPDVHGGLLHARIASIREMLRTDPDLSWRYQQTNVAYPRTPWSRTAREIMELPCGDYLFVGAGTAGSLMDGVGCFRTLPPITRTIAEDGFDSSPGNAVSR